LEAAVVDATASRTKTFSFHWKLFIDEWMNEWMNVKLKQKDSIELWIRYSIHNIPFSL